MERPRSTSTRSGKPGQLREVRFNFFNYDCAGHAVESLAMTLSVRVRMVPIQSWRVVLWNLNGIAQGFPGHSHHVQDVILRGIGRNLQAVKMQIGHVHTRGDRATLRGFGRKVINVGNLELVSGRDSQRRCYWLAVEVKGVLSFGSDAGVQSQGQCVIFARSSGGIRKRGSWMPRQANRAQNGDRQNSDSRNSVP